VIRRFGLSLLLIIAGFIHLIQPALFLRALPDFLPFRIELILISGVFEILLGIGLLTKKFLNFTARLTALYLFLLIPIHIYVSWNGIEIFGITNPIWLWLRTAFQWPLIYMALSLQTTGWIIQQSWRHVLFLHYKINPDLIAPMVPFKLDLHEGEAVISIVPLLMNKIRFPYLPSIPWVSQLWELNIRTYVEVNGIKGVYFFTLETDSKLGEYIAQTFFNLPYRYSKIKSSVSSSNYSIIHSRGDISSNLKVKTGQTKQFCTFDFWATERYSLFTTKNNTIYRGIVMHRPWQLKSVAIEDINENLSNQFNLKEMRFVGASYSEGLDVKFRPFIKMTEINKV
jgi:uncharacterized protein YqjF (DUF2071 family)/uncharacterized membrane protein